MKKIKTALLSYGMSGRVFHEPFLTTHPGFELYAVLERTKNLAALQNPDIITYRNLEELLNDKNIELVIVNTPNTTHFDFTKQALLAGKHVIVEKPFTATSAEAAELIGLAEKYGRKLSVYQNRRWDSDFKTVQKVVNDQTLGEIVEAEIHFDRFNQVLSPKPHKEAPAAGIGTLYDLGSHIIDQAVQLFGMPEAVFADLARLRPGSQIDDYSEVLLYYSLLRVRIRTSYIVREPLPSYILHGRKGSFLKSRADLQETRLQAGERPDQSDWGTEPDTERGLLHTEINGEVVRTHIPTEQGDYTAYYEGIYQSIREDAPLPVTAQQAMGVIQIIEKALESNREKKVVSMNTKT